MEEVSCSPDKRDCLLLMYLCIGSAPLPYMNGGPSVHDPYLISSKEGVKGRETRDYIGIRCQSQECCSNVTEVSCSF